MSRARTSVFLISTTVAAVLTPALSASVSAPASASASASARHFANCTAMHRVYPHGVGTLHARDHVSSGTPVTTFRRNNALYAANTSMDRDHDHVACEKR